jgi:hypothetical protein
MPGNCNSYSEPFIADIISVQATFRRSRFEIKGFEVPQYCPFRLQLGVKTLLHWVILAVGW